MVLFEDVFFGKKKRGTPPSFFPVIGERFFGGGGESLPETVSKKLCVCVFGTLEACMVRVKGLYDIIGLLKLWVVRLFWCLFIDVGFDWFYDKMEKACVSCFFSGVVMYMFDV